MPCARMGRPIISGRSDSGATATIAIEIVAVAPESLRPEIIGRPMRAQGIEFQLQLFSRPRRIAQADAEAIAGQRAAPELARIGAYVEYLEFSRDRKST